MGVLDAVRVTNIGNNKTGGKDTADTDQLGSEIAFDGQNYYVGPHDNVTLPIAGMANVSASTVLVIDDKNAKVKYPDYAAGA
jgi:hypothetical protein